MCACVCVCVCIYNLNNQICIICSHLVKVTNENNLEFNRVNRGVRISLRYERPYGSTVSVENVKDGD